MADEANTQAAEETQQASVEQTTADSQSETQTQGSGASSTEQAGENTTQSDETKSDASTGDQQQSNTQDSKQEKKPLSRRSAAYRLGQILPEYTRLKAEDEKRNQQQNDAQDDWDKEPRTDEQKQPSIAEMVQQEVDRRLTPVITESSKVADDVEIGELFAGNNVADRTKYEGEIRKLWNLPQYKDVAAADLFNMLRGKEMETTIAKAKQEAIEEHKKAEKEAKDSSANGNSNTNRTGKSGKSVAEMTPAELEAHNQRVIAGLPA